MRDILALALLIIVFVCAKDPATFGSWLKKVDDARYITTDYK